MSAFAWRAKRCLGKAVACMFAQNLPLLARQETDAHDRRQFMPRRATSGSHTNCRVSQSISLLGNCSPHPATAKLLTNNQFSGQVPDLGTPCPTDKSLFASFSSEKEESW
jgi:hypothetical protein